MAGQPLPAAAPTHDRHALTGRSVAIDRRIHAARPDLTDVRLAARVFAPHYAAAMPLTALSLIAVRADADRGSAILSELLPGETFDVLELSEDAAWGISGTDGVVGYVDPAALAEHATPTHRVTATSAALREAPDLNASTLATLPMGARIAALGERGQFLLTDHGYIAMCDVITLDAATPPRIAEAALRAIGIPDKTGGRSGAGADCAGLMVLVLDCCGIAAPRFADLQRETLGEELSEDADIRQGDLIFFRDHCAIMVSDRDAIHLDGRVVRVSLAEIVASDRFGPVVVKRRVA